MQQGNKTTAPEIDFGEFAPATYAEWREAAVAALKGADFDKKLFTKLVEGITLHDAGGKHRTLCRQNVMPGNFRTAAERAPWAIWKSPAKSPRAFPLPLLRISTPSFCMTWNAA